MYYHNKYPEALTLVKSDIPLMLIGEAGTGKTTIIKQIAEELNLEFFCISMTRQTTLSSLIGYKNIEGVYQPTELRRAVEHGGLLLLDEIDAADANVLLCINTLENGFMSFPDGVVEKHKDFRICATANPQNKHYTGRSQLDAATLDRFDIVNLPSDKKLETSIVGEDVADIVQDVRDILAKYSYQKHISMRDAIRYHKRKSISLTEGFLEKLMSNNQSLIEDFYKLRESKTFIPQSECTTVEQLFLNVKKSQGIFDDKLT